MFGRELYGVESPEIKKSQKFMGILHWIKVRSMETDFVSNTNNLGELCLLKHKSMLWDPNQLRVIRNP